MGLFDAVTDVASSIGSALGSWKKGDDQSDSAKKAEKEWKKEAKQRKKLTKLELQRHEQNKQRIAGSIKVAAARSGDPVSAGGSSFEVFLDSMRQADLDAKIIKQGGKAQVGQALRTADSYGRDADDYQDAAMWQAGTTLVTNFSKMDWSWLGI